MRFLPRTKTTRFLLSVIIVCCAGSMTSEAHAQLRGLGGINLSRMGGLSRSSNITTRSGNATRLGNAIRLGNTTLGGRSSSTNLERVLPQVLGTVGAIQSVRGRSALRPAPTRVCPPPAPAPPVVTPVPPPPVAVEVPTVEETKMTLARTLVDRAKEAFAKEDYARCSDVLTEVLELMPEDANAYQFRSLAFFAQQDFEKAAADAYDSFRFGNAWTWDTVLTIYPEKQSARYTTQLRGLEKINKSESQSMSTHFLLAYHYIVLGHLPQAERELTTVLTLNPEEKLSQQLLAVVKNAQQTDKVSQR
ncbi:MAG: hypothetical protein AAGG48_15585 [Planctomycetota bacterium]